MAKNKHLLLWTSVASIVLLGAAISDEHFRQEWRRMQIDYRQQLPEESAVQFPIQLRQIVAPALQSTDRCVTCHLGMIAGGEEIAGHPAFGAHPDVVHDPAEYGCTVCHGGQGRATRKDDAHGRVPHWPEPMLLPEMSYAGCGSCHTHLTVPSLAQLQRGQALFERYDCLSCHSLEGRGGTLRPGQEIDAGGPDLSRAGIRSFESGWYDEHLEQHRTAETGRWKTSFGEIPAGDRTAIEVFLSSRVGAPGLVESKSLFHTLGCRGCHAVGGVGGDDGPELTQVGQKDPGQLDFTHVSGERSVPNWFAEHFRAPGKLVPGSQMPAMELSDSEIQLLNFYLLSLRRAPVPQAYWPRDRVRAEHLGEREFSTDGETLFTTFCSACHGDQGQGRRYAGMEPFPAIANPDFLSLASDEFLTETVRRGRPGRRMPAWGDKEGGLRPGEIEEVVRYLRTLTEVAPPAPEEESRWITGNATLGGRLYASACASCHGEDGRGQEGPALNNPVLLEIATDRYLFETIRRGRSGTTMPAFGSPSLTQRMLSQGEMEAIVAYIRNWETQP